jgi:hypothetical protein
MKDENQKNEALQGPVILTLRASLTVPGFGFLVALNPDWRFTWQERKASSALSVGSRLFGCARRATTTRQRLSE